MRKWFNGLQALRALLFIMVYISHSGKFFVSYGIWGAAAVEVFFVLSGFLSAGKEYTLLDKTPIGIFKTCWNSCWRKIKAFYPLYIVFLLVALVVKFSSWSDFIKCIFLTQSFWGNADTALAFNWPTWFLSSILLSYFLSPLLNMFCKKFEKYSEVLMICIFVLLFLWSFFWRNDAEAYGLGYYMVYICPAIRLFDFLEGILLYQVYQKYARQKPREYDFLFEGFVFLVFIAELILFQFVPRIFQYTAMWIPIAIMLVWLFAWEKTDIVRYMSTNKYLLWVGERSFELYITHRLILGCFSKIEPSVTYWLLATVTTFIISSLAYKVKNLYKK